MIYLVLGVTGTVVPVIVEDLVRKDPVAFFYFALRRDAADRERLRANSRLVEIDVGRDPRPPAIAFPARYDQNNPSRGSFT